MDPGRVSTSSTASSDQRDGGGTSSVGGGAAAEAGAPEFPAGLRVLVVEDDRVCLAVIAKMLSKCMYRVTTCTHAEEALTMLREQKGRFDLVLSDVYMPDMDGFKLLECIGLEMDLPVIMMSSEERQDAVMKGVLHGACDYLIKPVRMEPLKNIWQHVVRRRRHEWKETEQHSGSIEDSDQKQKRVMDEGDNASSRCDGTLKSAKRRKEEEEEEEEAEDRDDQAQQKRPRVVWSAELHAKFVVAVNQLGVEKAVPKKILELMDVPGLTRENVASHLQKFRLYIKRLSETQHQGRQDSIFPNAQEAEVLAADSFNFQTIPVSNQHLTPSLAALQTGQGRALNAPMGMSTFEQVNNRPMSYLAGGTNNLNLRQYGHSQPMVQPYPNSPLQLGEGTSGFLSFASSQTTNSSFSRGIIGGQLNKSSIMPITQQGNQLYLSRQECNMHMNLPTQLQPRGQVINGAESHESLFSLTSSYQVPSNNLSSHFSGMNGNNARAPTILPGNHINAYSYNAAPPALNADVQNASTSGSFESDYQMIGRIGSTSLPNPQKIGPTTLKEVTEMCPDQNPDWNWENENLPYQSDQHLGSKQIAPNFGASHVGHKDSIVTNNGGWQEVLTAKPDTEHQCNNTVLNIVLPGNSVRLKLDGSSNIFFDKDATSNELMSMVLKKQEGTGAGQLDNTEFNLDAY